MTRLLYCPVLCHAVLVFPQVTLFIGGVLDTEAEVTRVLTPFGSIVRTAIITNPAVSHSAPPPDVRAQHASGSSLVKAQCT